MRDGALLAQPFNEKTLEVSGDSVTTAGPIGFFVDRAFFSASVNGTLHNTATVTTDAAAEPTRKPAHSAGGRKPNGAFVIATKAAASSACVSG